MIYTSYISKLATIPDDYFKLIITRYNKIDMSKYKNCFHAAMLSPSEDLLKDWKDEKIDAKTFCDRLLNQINDDAEAIGILKKIMQYDKHDRNVVLICYEKELNTCHRYIIAKILEKSGAKVGYEV